MVFFNHSGYYLAPWQDVLSKGTESEYFDLFMINTWPLSEGGGHAQKGEYADHPRVIQFQKVGWSDNYIEIIINTSEEDVEIAQKGEVLFARHYIDTALLCNGILIRRIKE